MTTRLDPAWEQVQHRSFMAWVNNNLKNQEGFNKLDDLPNGFETGENLVKLVEILSGKKARHAIKKDPDMRIQKIQNAKIALDIVDSEKIKLINISAEDVADGKLKAILGLIWSLILRYQINKNNEKRKVKKIKTIPVIETKKDEEQKPEPKQVVEQVVEEEEEEITVQKSDSGAKRDLLQWVQNQVKDYGVPCKDFTNSWQDGKLLTALIHSLSPDLIDYPPIIDPLGANTTAINIANSKMGIPEIIDPEDITLKPEELSMMTYISYFRDYQIENAKKQQELKEIAKVDPEQSKLEGPSQIECGDIATLTITAMDKDGNIKIKLDDDDTFIISITSPKLTEPLQPMVNAKGDGNFVAEFCPPLPGIYRAYAAINGSPLKNTPHSITVPRRTDPSKCLLYGPGLKQDGSVKVQKETNFTIQSRDRAGDTIKVGGDRFEVSIKAENSRVPNKLSDNKNGTYTVNYSPQLAIDHIVTVTLDGRIVGSQASITVPVTSDRKISALNSRASGPGIEPWGLMTSQPTQFTIFAVDQDGKDMTNGDLTSDFDIKFVNGRTEEPVQVETKVVDNDDGTYTVSYEAPAISGPYALSVAINHQDLADSPFDVFIRGEISYPDTIMTGLSSLLRSDVPVEYTIHARDKQGDDIHNGGDEFEVIVTYHNPDSDDSNIPVTVEDNQDGTHTIRWVPKRAGQYKVMASSKDGIPIKNSPVILNMEPTPYAPYSRIKPKAIARSHKGMVTADFDLSAHDKFNKKFDNIKAKLSARVIDEDGNNVEAQVIQNKDGTFAVKFDPKKNKNKYTCAIHLDGREVGSGPVSINLAEPYLDEKAQLKRKISPCKCEAYGPGLEGANRDSMAIFTVEARDDKGQLIQANRVDPDLFKKNGDIVKRLLNFQPKAFDSATNPFAPYLDLRELRKNHQNKKIGAAMNDPRSTMTADPDDYGDEVLANHKSPDISHDKNPVDNRVPKGSLLNPFTSNDPAKDIVSPRGAVKDANLTKEPAFADDMEESTNPCYQDVPHNYLQEQKDQCPVKIKICPPHGDHERNSNVDPIVLNTAPGTFTVLYLPTDKGEHEINITMDDQHIPKSPFTAIVADEPDAIHCGLEGPGLKKAYVDKPTYFNIIARDADNRDVRVGGDDFEVFLKDPTGAQATNPIIIDDLGTGTYKVTYTPSVPGIHTVSVKYRGDHLRDSPFKVTARATEAMPDNMKCTLMCKVENTPAKKPCKYNVKLANTKGEDILSGGDIVRAIIRPKKDNKISVKNNAPEFEAYVVDHGTGRYTVEFTPEYSGDYEMFINVGSDELPINDTCFEFTVLPSVSTLYTKLSNWKFDIESEKELDTKDLHINFTSPQNVAIVPFIEKKHEKLFTVHYEPTEIETGWYEMNITLANKSKVRGSPFLQTFAYMEHFEQGEPQQSDHYVFENI